MNTNNYILKRHGIASAWITRHKNIFVLTLGLLLSLSGLAQAQYYITPIDVPGAVYTAANANSVNEIAGQYDDADGNTHGFILKSGKFSAIDIDGAAATIVNGINVQGQFTGTYFDAGGTSHAFVCTRGVYTTLNPPGSIRSQGGFINTFGVVVGAYRDATQKRHGFIWNNGVYTSFNVPGDHTPLGTVPLGINDLGQIVGSYVDAAGVRHGFVRSWTGAYTILDAPDADGLTVAEGINDRGQVVGLYFDVDGVSHGFTWKDGVFTTVDVPGAVGTQVYSINLLGEIVGTYDDADGNSNGFVGALSRFRFFLSL